jgi:hypothetical protein
LALSCYLLVLISEGKIMTRPGENDNIAAFEITSILDCTQ